jgi:hypothetical protein
MVGRRGEEAVAFRWGLIERQAASALCIGRFCDRVAVSTAAIHSPKLKLAFCLRRAGLSFAPARASAFVPVLVFPEAGVRKCRCLAPLGQGVLPRLAACKPVMPSLHRAVCPWCLARTE